MFLTEVGSPARADPRLWRTVGFTPGSHNVAAGVGSSRRADGVARASSPADRRSPTSSPRPSAAGPGAGGVLALPYFAGERTPWFDPDLRGALFGLTAAHGRGHVFRALLEASAFAVRHNLEVMAEAGATIARLRGQRRRRDGPAVAADRLRRHRPASGRADRPAGRVWAPRCSRPSPPAPRRSRRGGCGEPAVVEPDPSLRAVYDELYGQFRELALATAAQAHALAAWQRDHS